ncbi:MAG TPA: ketohydroxyglutarate aldolase [Thermoanaerobaculia bacterium]
MTKKDTKVQVLVSVDDQHLPHIQEVVKHCKAAGLSVEQTLDKVGTITGSISPRKLSALSKVSGIASVERSQDYEIAPPDSDVQ